ncbi:CTP synthase [Frankliniella fusca]|uniref:CTP synthase n=1 Tax=Frankliniella fusca TaxID=407009 RepID=A0AAE1L7Z5_9NEOP|nr:CTP synthase [Frankliniella fusca]
MMGSLQRAELPQPPIECRRCEAGGCHIGPQVRKRSRTVHRDQVAVTDDTPQLPPGRRRFDAVLPDEQGHDPAPAGSAGAPGQGRRARGQRSQRPPSLDQDAANEVAAAPAEPQVLTTER